MHFLGIKKLFRTVQNRKKTEITSLLLACLLSLCIALVTDAAPKKKKSASPLIGGLDIAYGQLSYHGYALSPTQTMGSKSHSFRIALERLIKNLIGIIGLGTAVSFSFSGNNAVEPDQKATLVTLPVEFFVEYRLGLMPDQLLVPYLRVGFGFTLIRQTSTDGAGRPDRGNFHYDYVLGIGICLDPLDPKYARELDANMGVNSTYLVAEYATAGRLGPGYAPDTSHIAYRIGLRFEF